MQYDIVKLLTIDPKSSSVFVVGDADQSIYAFRGADIRNVRQFIKDFDAQTILLEMNYRSTNPIAASAQAVRSAQRASRQRVPVPLHSL